MSHLISSLDNKKKKQCKATARAHRLPLNNSSPKGVPEKSLNSSPAFVAQNLLITPTMRGNANWKED